VETKKPKPNVFIVPIKVVGEVGLAELSTAFGLAHPDGSANLAKKAKQLLGDSKKYKNNYHRIKETLLKTENQA